MSEFNPQKDQQRLGTGNSTAVLGAGFPRTLEQNAAITAFDGGVVQIQPTANALDPSHHGVPLLQILNGITEKAKIVLDLCNADQPNDVVMQISAMLASKAPGGFFVVDPPPRFERVLSTMRMEERVPIAQSPDDAVVALGGNPELFDRRLFAQVELDSKRMLEEWNRPKTTVRRDPTPEPDTRTSFPERKVAVVTLASSDYPEEASVGEHLRLALSAPSREGATVIVDLASVRFFGTGNVGALIAAKKELSEKGGRLIVCGAIDRVAEKLITLGFLTDEEVSGPLRADILTVLGDLRP